MSLFQFKLLIYITLSVAWVGISIIGIAGLRDMYRMVKRKL